MKQEYFVHNGIKYLTGTFISLSRFDYMANRSINTKAKFLWYDTDTKEYGIEIYGVQYNYNQVYFNRIFKGLYDPNYWKPKKPQPKVKESHTFSDELRIDGLAVAWVWYIFIMCVGILFYDRIGIWILASIIFFGYRKKKLKEAGYK